MGGAGERCTHMLNSFMYVGRRKNSIIHTNVPHNGVSLDEQKERKLRERENPIFLLDKNEFLYVRMRSHIWSEINSRKHHVKFSNFSFCIWKEVEFEEFNYILTNEIKITVREKFCHAYVKSFFELKTYMWFFYFSPHFKWNQVKNKNWFLNTRLTWYVCIYARKIWFITEIFISLTTLVWLSWLIAESDWVSWKLLSASQVLILERATRSLTPCTRASKNFLINFNFSSRFLLAVAQNCWYAKMQR